MTATTLDEFRDIPPVSTKAEAMQILRLSERRIEELVRDGRLVAKYEGHKPLFLRPNLVAYLTALPEERAS